jgi:hypothetical protein
VIYVNNNDSGVPVQYIIEIWQHKRELNNQHLYCSTYNLRLCLCKFDTDFAFQKIRANGLTPAQAREAIRIELTICACEYIVVNCCVHMG